MNQFRRRLLSSYNMICYNQDILQVCLIDDEIEIETLTCTF